MDDWLEEEGKLEQLPAVVTVPVDFASRVAMVEDCWSRLPLNRRTFLTAMRQNRFNINKSSRKLGISKANHQKWKEDPDYATVLQIWRGTAASEALDRDRLLVRQDDIVETLLTPKPVLYQGSDTGFKEVDGSAAARANETLMKAAGLLKDKEVEINVGLVGPSLNIQVVQADNSVREISNDGVAVQLAEPLEADWMEIPADGT